MPVDNAKWLYQARRVATQANIAGGAIRGSISPATGTAFRVVQGYVSNSGTNGLTSVVRDEDGTACLDVATITSAASTRFSIPAPGATATTTSNRATSEGLLIVQGQGLYFEQTAAGAQNDTLTVAITLELIGNSTEPTWGTSTSANAADVTLAANTIGANVITPLLEG